MEQKSTRRWPAVLAGVLVALVLGVIGFGVLFGMPLNGNSTIEITDVEVSNGALPTSTAAGKDLSGKWALSALVDSGGDRSLLASEGQVWISFKDDTFEGHTECNRISGVYKQSGDAGENVHFPVRRMFTTLVGCDESPLMQRLEDVRHVSGEGDTRRLHAKNWMIIAQLDRR